MSLDTTIDALLPDWPPLGPALRAEVSAHCVGFVRAQLRLAPFHIRAGFKLLFAVFRLYALLRPGRPLARSLQEFSSLPFPMVSGVERLLRAATMLAFFDDALVLAALREDSAGLRQHKHRALRQGIAS